MKRIWISIGLGLLSPFIAFLGAEPFEVPGQNPLMERVGAGLAGALYCAVCQFLLTRRNAKVANSSWPSVVAMVLAIGAICLLQLVAEGFGSWPYFAVPFFIACLIGAVAGMVLGRSTGRLGDA
jgi:tetrahydromethanopterin S-methyltransferase subunit C